MKEIPNRLRGTACLIMCVWSFAIVFLSNVTPKGTLYHWRGMLMPVGILILLACWWLYCVTKFTIEGADGSPYMVRYTLWKTKRGGIYVHNILRDDEDEPHDHPWDFTSVILRGGYYEAVGQGPVWAQFWKWKRPFTVIRHKAEDVHKIKLPYKPHGEVSERMPAWTLVFVGPKRREWGFHTDKGWVHWQQYMDFKFGKDNWVKGGEV